LIVPPLSFFGERGKELVEGVRDKESREIRPVFISYFDNNSCHYNALDL
jgi:hypothetical protein